MFFFYLLQHYTRGGVSISPVGDHKDRRDLLEVCGQITNKTLLIKEGILNLYAYGFDQDKYEPDRHNQSARVLGHYRAESRNVTTIIGKTYKFSKAYEVNKKSKQ